MYRCLALGLLASTPALAGPAMVTTTNGEVELVAPGKPASAPSAPFILQDGMTLKLAAGAQAVLLYNGTAKRIVGPATATTESVEEGKAVSGQGKATSMLDELLSVQHSQAQAGAHRGGVQMSRPVPGGDVLALREIRWTCEGCGAQKVQVIDFLEGETLWTGEGEGTVRYAGPALQGDSFQVAIGDERFTVYLAGEGKRSALAKAQQAAVEPMRTLESEGDAVGATSVMTGLYMHIGLESEALWLADDMVAKHPSDPGFTALRDGLEKRALRAK